MASTLADLRGTHPCKSSGGTATIIPILLVLNCCFCVGTTLSRPVGDSGYISAQREWTQILAMKQKVDIVSLCLAKHELFNFSMEHNNLIGQVNHPVVILLGKTAQSSAQLGNTGNSLQKR